MTGFSAEHWPTEIKLKRAEKRLDIAFDDGRFFHRVDLSSGADAFVHGCAPDTYSGSWAIYSPDQFTVRWTIEGPAKRIAIGSNYRRG